MKQDYIKLINDLMFSVWDYGWHCGHIDDHEDEEVLADRNKTLKLEKLLESEVEHDLVALLNAIGIKPENYKLCMKDRNPEFTNQWNYTTPYLKGKKHD